MPVTLPDATKFDSDSDTIKESRPELKKMADAINTIGAEYNAGTLGGGTLTPLTTNYLTTTMGGSVTLPFETAINYIGIGLDDNDSSGNTGQLDIALDNWVNSGICYFVLMTEHVDGSSGGTNSIDVMFTYGGNNLTGFRNGLSATGSVVYQLTTLLFPPQTQYASNFNLDISVFIGSVGIGGNVYGNYYIDSAGGRQAS